jgi:hypothetical protein
MREEPADRPVRLVVTDDLARSRATVFFRLLLAIPLYLLVAFWTIAVMLVVILAWVVALVGGRVPRGLHGFMASYVRYTTRTSAYLYLLANPYPGFSLVGAYPVDIEIDGPQRQGRWTIFFRLFLALPALLLTGLTGGTGGSLNLRRDPTSTLLGSGTLATTAAFLGWFASLARGRMPQGLRDVGAYSIGYTAQTSAYLLLLTDRYPSSDPRLAGPQELPPHPIRIEVNDDLVRGRLLVLFRGLLILPHLVWLALWSVAALAAALAGWLVAPLIARLPSPLHRFLAAYVRYVTHVSAFFGLVGGLFPGFVGREGMYPIDVVIDPPARQGRAGLLFRGFLVVPAVLMAIAYSGVSTVVAVLGWWSSLVRGRMPIGMRDLGAAAIRYQAQMWAYSFLLTDRYPYAAPTLEEMPPEPVHQTLGLTPEITG